MHTHQDMGSQQPSRAAFHVMGLILRGGGTVRMRPLLAAAGLSVDALAAAINELVASNWARIVWRGPAARRPITLPERLREPRRVVATRFGRWRYRTTWPS